MLKSLRGGLVGKHDGLIARPEDIANTEDVDTNTTVDVAAKPEDITANNGTGDVAATEAATRSDIQEGTISISSSRHRTRKSVRFAESTVSLTRAPHAVPPEDKVEDAEPDFSAEGDRQRRAAEDGEEEPIDIRRAQRDAEVFRNRTGPDTAGVQRSMMKTMKGLTNSTITYFEEPQTAADENAVAVPAPAIPEGPGLPQNDMAVRIQDMDRKMGKGVYLKENLPRKHTVLDEPPAIVCRYEQIGHWYGRRRTVTNIADEWRRLTVVERGRMCETFTNLHGVPTEVDLLPADERTLKEFIVEYRFRDVANNNNNCYIFKFGSHINHACDRCANCLFMMDNHPPHRIRVRLRHNVYAGQELFIHYGRPVNFNCPMCYKTIRTRIRDAKNSAARKIKRM